jgi:hypothetical protein
MDPGAVDSVRPGHPRPELVAEWRVVLVLTGCEEEVFRGDEESARFYIERFHHASFRFERRMVGPWARAGPMLKATTTITEVAEDASGAEHTEAGD